MPHGQKHQMIHTDHGPPAHGIPAGPLLL